MKDIHPEAFDELSFASHFNVSHNLLSNMSQVESDLNPIFYLTLKFNSNLKFDQIPKYNLVLQLI